MAAPGRPAASLPPDIEAAELPADAIEVGRILDAWGVKGWFKVLPHSADPQALFSSTRWYLQPSDRGPQAFAGTVLLRVRETKEHSDAVVARADAVEDRNTAELLKGARIRFPKVGVGFPGLPKPDPELAGVTEESATIGATAVNFLVSLVQHGQRGIPAHPQRVHVEGVWNEGRSLRPAR